jgi:hypothetical protein
MCNVPKPHSTVTDYRVTSVRIRCVAVCTNVGVTAEEVIMTYCDT